MNLRSAIAERLSFRLSVCGIALLVTVMPTRAAEEPPHSAELDAAIIKQAKRNGVPEKLVRRIVMRESKYNARARNRSFWGLMQISYPTAKSMGFKGTPTDLLNPFVNLTYAVPYLANAFVIAGQKEDAAVRLYASGYYRTAKERGLLGVLRTADTKPVSGEVDVPISVASAEAPAQSFGVFGALFGPGQQPQAAPELTVQTAYNAPQGSSLQPASGGRSAASALPGGMESKEPPVAMATDKAGALHPPKKWLKDGGVSNIARGEQRIEQVAAFEKAGDDATHRKVAQTRSRKNTTFAAIDIQPTGAQAYAATSGAQDTALVQTGSQAAIQQVTGGLQPGAVDPAAPDAVQPVGAEPQASGATPAREHVKASHTTRSAQKGRADGKVKIAQDDSQTKAAKHVKTKKQTETVASERPDDSPLRSTAQ